MKKLAFAALLLASNALFAAEKEEWEATTLSEDSIKNIQAAKHDYLLCIGNELQKQAYVEMDTRVATDKIVEHCEEDLAKIREVFLDEDVPANIADRYLKQTRTQTTRKVLEQMIYAAAARQGGK